MGEGRLIRVSKYRGDPQATAYLVALAEKAEATDLVRDVVANLGDEIKDMGRVSEALISAMRLAPSVSAPVAQRYSIPGRTSANISSCRVRWLKNNQGRRTTDPCCASLSQHQQPQ